MTGSPFEDAYQRAVAAVQGSGGPRPIIEYQRDPIGFAVNILGVRRESLVWSLNPGYEGHQWDGTADPMQVVAESLAKWDDCGVESGTGTGKSFFAACLVYWFLGSWQNARAFTFAAKEDQLRLYIWTELRKLFSAFQRHFPTAELTDLCLRVRGGQDDAWAAHGYSVGVRAGEEIAAKAKGMHAEHMLLIYEETQGIMQPVIEAGANTCTGPHNNRLFLGNPDNQLDTLHVACTSPGVVHVRVSALDHPNVVTGTEVVPGAASRKSIGKAVERYGVEDRLYLSQVRGISPAESAEALIRLEWIHRAQERWRQKMASGLPATGYGLPALGVDVANSESGDDAAIASGFGYVCMRVEAEACPDANRLGWKVAKRLESEGVMDRHVGVDSVGVGAGCFNELGRLKHYVQSLNGGASPKVDVSGEEEFHNLRAQMWWRAREDLRTDVVDLPPDADLATDLVTPKWESRNGKILIESKEAIRKRLPSGRSPNKGDAFVYWNFVRDRSPVASVRPQSVRSVAGDPIFRRAGSPEEYDPNAIAGNDDPRESYTPGALGGIAKGF